MAIEATLSLTADPASASKARRFVRETLDNSGALEFEEGAVLLVSELVTNAVLHTRTDPEVTLRFNDGRLWIGVRDGSPVTPAPKRYPPEAATGRGLQLVERIAASWGVEKLESGKVVWFELDDESVERFATAQAPAMVEEFAAIDMDFAELDNGPARSRGGDGASSRPTASLGGRAPFVTRFPVAT